MSRSIGWTLGTVLICLSTAGSAAEPVTGQRVTRPIASRLFRHQYTIYDREFCGAQVCADFDNDGQRELLYASRDTGNLQQLKAADGTIVWSRKLPGQQQSVSAFDLDSDGRFEILYSVSDPGTLYQIDAEGKLLKSYDSGDNKLGNSAVIVDADGDRVWDAFFGSRQQYLIRMNLAEFKHIAKRDKWVQCGCYTSAMDVDHDGRWDLFAGSGDDYASKGVLHRIDPVTLQSVWSVPTNDNASSADAVLADIDGDGQVEIIKSVDNYKQDDAHDAVYALDVDGTVRWRVPGLSGEDSPNVADLDGDGSMEIVGMTFGAEVYCLNAQGKFKWRRDLRPELDDGQHMYMAPILCDLDGDAELEILAMTHGQYAPEPGLKPDAMLFALDARGRVIDQFNLGESRFWGHALVTNVDDDPFLELVVSGYGGLDVIETRGLGPQTEHFQRRRSYQRLNVLPWAYEDSYFMYRGTKNNVVTRTDNLVLTRADSGYARRGTFVTEPLQLPPGCLFTTLSWQAREPAGTSIQVNVLDSAGKVRQRGTVRGARLGITGTVRLEFVLTTDRGTATPTLDDYSLRFARK
ncbi:MAG: PQQ-binding-like beta-propeller repeat protein [Pirellulales bacterium]|nr:PQQ-binding-like beta-propeller repeat protein [Pirellulales bacterium]